MPIAGVGEEGQGGIARYECCTFRGSVSALDASTGAVIWKSYTITEEPKPKAQERVRRADVGTRRRRRLGRTDDRSRRVVSCTSRRATTTPAPATNTTDAVIAMDMETGKHRWVYQPTPNDVWTGGCRPENPADSNCPEKLGPDHDFSIAPLLTKAPNGRDLVIVQQKSGMAYAVDPDKGTLVWQYKTSDGSGMGGQWGIAADDTSGVLRRQRTTQRARRHARDDHRHRNRKCGRSRPPDKLCGTARGCSAAQGAALTVDSRHRVLRIAGRRRARLFSG